jgi:Uma2 family endonuclease
MFDPEIVKPERLRPLNRKEYDHLVDLGYFEDEKIELLRGALVTMSPQKWPHAGAVTWLNNELARQLDRAYLVRPGLPFAVDDTSEPEPDLVVVRAADQVRAHPQTALLVIEVSHSSLRLDRGLKLTIYAEAKVPEYWIVDVKALTVTVHTVPQGDGYASIVTLRDGDVLRPTLLPSVALPVADLPR